jgi:FkbM family methyltransferase
MAVADPLIPDLGFIRLKQCRHGRMIYNINDIYVGRSLDLYGEYSEGETEVFAQLVNPGDVVIEVGANIGTSTVWFGKRVGPTGAVVALEPQRVVFQILCANVALNGLTNVNAIQQAVGAQRGSINVPMIKIDAPNNFGGLELTDPAAPRGQQVPLVRLDDLRLGRCNLLKVDVEGMELAVLQGGADLIRRCRPILYVENDRPHLSDPLVRFIDSLGYDAYWHRPPLFNPNNFFGNAENVFGNIVSVNMLCVPKGTPVEGSVKVEVPRA